MVRGPRPGPVLREAPLQAMAGPGPHPEHPSLPLLTPRVACQAPSCAPPHPQEEGPLQRTEEVRKGLGPTHGHPWSSSQTRSGPGLPGVPTSGLWSLGTCLFLRASPYVLLGQGCSSDQWALQRSPAPGRPTRTSASSCCRLSLPSKASSWPSRWKSCSWSSSAFSASSRTCFRSASFSCRLRECCACSPSRVAMACRDAQGRLADCWGTPAPPPSPQSVLAGLQE